MSLLLLTGSPALAQQTGSVDHPAATKRNPAKVVPQRKPLDLRNSKTARPGERAGSSSGEGWTIDDALLTPRSGKVKEVPDPPKPNFGRLNLDTGSFGFETEAKVKGTRLPDGRPVPGLDVYKREDPSYFGLSLSLPTRNNSLVPAPLLPWDRKD